MTIFGWFFISIFVLHNTGFIDSSILMYIALVFTFFLEFNNYNILHIGGILYEDK